jgi:outer membrane protein assembly factor BamD
LFADLLIYKMKKLLVTLLFSVLAFGCSRGVDLEGLATKKEAEIFALGSELMNNEKYSDAAAVFGEFSKLHPYAAKAAKAQIHKGYCHYKDKDHKNATVSFSVFIKTHTTHEEVPYALYMLGLIEYDMMLIVERDQEAASNAYRYFSELVARYPKSKYHEEAKHKIADIKEHMAGKEMEVARFYQSLGNFVAAIGRLNTVITSYGDTNHSKEALCRLVECFLSIGATDEAKKISEFLSKKHPSSKWAIHADSMLGKKKEK